MPRACGFEGEGEGRREGGREEKRDEKKFQRKGALYLIGVIDLYSGTAKATLPLSPSRPPSSPTWMT